MFYSGHWDGEEEVGRWIGVLEATKRRAGLDGVELGRRHSTTMGWNKFIGGGASVLVGAATLSTVWLLKDDIASVRPFPTLFVRADPAEPRALRSCFNRRSPDLAAFDSRSPR